MASLRDVSLRHSRWYLSRLTDLSNRYRIAPEVAKVCREEMHWSWAQFQAGQSWACRNSEDDGAAAFVASGYAGLCSEVGGSLLEVHQTQTLRAAWLRAGVVAAREVGDELGEATHLYNLGLVLMTIPEVKKGLRAVRRAKRIFVKRKDSSSEMAALNALGLGCSALKEPQKAIQYHCRSLKLSRGSKLRRDEAVTLEFLGSAYALAGDTKKALKILKQASDAFHALDDKVSQGSALLKMAYVCLDADELDEGRRLSEKAAALIGEENSAADDLLQTRLAAFLLLLADPKAAEFTDQLVDEFHTSDKCLGEGMALVGRGALRARQGNAAEARAAFEEAHSRFREMGFRGGEELASRVMRRLTFDGGRGPSDHHEHDVKSSGGREVEPSG